MNDLLQQLVISKRQEIIVSIIRNFSTNILILAAPIKLFTQITAIMCEGDKVNPGLSAGE